MKRTGLILKKLGMSSFFRSGVHIPTTLLLLEECIVIDVRTEAKNGYNAVVLGVGEQAVHRMRKSEAGLFFKEGLPLKRKLAEFRVDTEALLTKGVRLSASHFVEGQYVDVMGITIGRGFTGAIKRHGLHGLRASHGVSATHRSLGSTGANQDPGRVWKNKKMSGRHGHHRKTTANLKVVFIDGDLIGLQGSIPGPKGSYVHVYDSKKKGPISAWNKEVLTLPFPAALLQSSSFDEAEATN